RVYQTNSSQSEEARQRNIQETKLSCMDYLDRNQVVHGVRLSFEQVVSGKTLVRPMSGFEPFDARTSPTHRYSPTLRPHTANHNSLPPTSRMLARTSRRRQQHRG